MTGDQGIALKGSGRSPDTALLPDLERDPSLELAAARTRDRAAPAGVHSGPLVVRIPPVGTGIVKPPGGLRIVSDEGNPIRIQPGRWQNVIIKHDVLIWRPPLRRAQVTVPIAPTGTPADTDVFESPDGSVRYVLPRYALQFDRIGQVDEPRLAIGERDGKQTLVVTLNEAPSAAAAAGRIELPHAVAVALRYNVPTSTGGTMLQNFYFTRVALDPTETIVTAELVLDTPGIRQQIVAALGSLSAGAMLVVDRTVTLGIPTAEKLEDGSVGYRVRRLNIPWTVPPSPLVLSAEQCTRLGGGGGGVQPLVRHRIPFEGRNHSYWQSPARPSHFYFLPDRFLLARAADGDRRPLLSVQAAARTGEDLPLIAFQFEARPTFDPDRLAAAQPQLEAIATARGATTPPVLEVVPDPQPLLRLALPQNGALSSAMTERPGADIDLETRLAHAETMPIEDFQLVYQALFGASLTLLRGEVRASATGGEPEDIPLELRVDKTVGDVLKISDELIKGFSVGCRLTNVIESPVRINLVRGAALLDDSQIPLRALLPDHRLAPGEHILISLEAAASVPATARIWIDQSDVAVEVDPAAIWGLIFDRRAAARLTRRAIVEAVPLMFSSPDRPGDRVAAFVVTIENGGTVRVTEAELRGETTVRLPVEPMITGAAMPPIRYQTETWWGSGGIGISPWRETNGTILFPVKTSPPA